MTTATTSHGGARTAAPIGAEPSVFAWVDSVATITRPDDILWCDGTTEEHDRLTARMVASGTLRALGGELRPNSFLARSDANAAARVESRTFICSRNGEDAGATNNWRDPAEMRFQLGGLCDGAMAGRTMYVIPFSMWPRGSPFAKVGVQLTDTPYVVVSMGVMTRMGSAVLAQIGPSTELVEALHTVGAPLVDGAEDVPWPCNPKKYISHFPEDRQSWSFGSAYGGNATLAKKSFALRIASVLARDEGWLAEHMLILKITNPAGRAFHLTAAFPSACGKPNLAMLEPTIPGWKVETIGDDIARPKTGADGSLRAFNPKAGFFGVAPGASMETNATAIETIWANTIFTNVALTDEGGVWWEGLSETAQDHLIDWRGADWTPASGTPAAHSNARFTVPASQCPTISDDWDDPDGVVIDAIIFGGRRAANVPLVVEARDWKHCVFMGATISSEQTAAAEGTDCRFVWPGFAENARLLAWMLERVAGEAQVVPTTLGGIPSAGGLNLHGLELSDDALAQLFEIDSDSWLSELQGIDEYFD